MTIDMHVSSLFVTYLSPIMTIQFISPLIHPGLGSITIVIDCNRLQLERNRNCNQIFQIVA